MTAFTNDQIAVLRRLKELWADLPFCLVGAGAIACQCSDYRRQTNDLDITVAIAAGDLPGRLAGFPQLQPHPKLEHQWRTPSGVRVDILPVDSAAIEAGELVWPKSGFRMNVLGFRLALERRQALDISRDLAIDVAPLAVIALLKMVSYQDRPHERERDLEDLAFLLDHYLELTDERRFSEAAVEAGIDYELESAFVLGRELKNLANPRELAPVRGFIALVLDADHSTGTQPRMARLGPVAWGRDPDQLLRRIRAFENGLR